MSAWDILLRAAQIYCASVLLLLAFTTWFGASEAERAFADRISAFALVATFCTGTVLLIFLALSEVGA